MGALQWLWQLPRDFEHWLILGYVMAVLVGARIIEALAKGHFSRAQRFAEYGFEYIEPRDHYQCLGGATLQLDSMHEAERVAIYRAQVEHCGGCRLKAQCAPNEASRTVYRSLASWAETDVGRFQQYISLLMFVVAVVLSLVGVCRWLRQPGVGYLILVLTGSLACLILQSSRMKALRRITTQSTSTPFNPDVLQITVGGRGATD